jgi:bifunctional NMN adenylyltransferase/nudix hydrolase
MEYNFLTFIGRFSPFHAGHYDVVKKALDKSEKVIIIVGSANRPRTAKNPLSFEERRQIIASAFPETDLARIVIMPCNDYAYSDIRWETQIQSIVNTVVHSTWRAGPTKIGIIGHSKDHSSYYLKKFPQWDLLEVPCQYNINATDIRTAVYENKPIMNEWFVSSSHKHEVEQALNSKNVDVPKKEHFHIIKYKKQFESLPYPPIFVTTDAVVVQSGHVLLVKRGGMPGEGLWALPGGFLNNHEYVEEGVLRELIEETKIGVRYPKLKGSIEKWFVADRPDRSQRGRTISHVALIKFPDGPLPSVKGSDDAKHAEWVELSKVKTMCSEMFEDHWDLLDQFGLM